MSREADGAAPGYRVAVRTLCEFTARKGDLDYRFTPAPSAREGIEGHARVVARRGPDYRTEVPLAGEVEGLQLVGRADGHDPRRGELEEIKTHRGDLSRMGEHQRALHWAQVSAYGALLCEAEALERVTLVLVYLDVVSGAETRLTRDAEAGELRDFLAGLCRQFRDWAEQQAAHRQRRDRALAELVFPHDDFRPGQRELAEDAYRTAASGRCLLAEAPTGIGKTLGALYPTLVAMPRRGIDRLAFLTMKTPGRRLALDALSALGAAAEAADRLPLRVLELVARDKACEHPDLACHGEACPLARGFYDRLPAARQAAVEHGWLDREGLREVALAHQVCPYYLGQELARWSDVLIGDVNHYFDDSALIHGLAQAEDWRLALLVDEAHNLVERARGMYSAALSQKRLNRLHRLSPPALKRPLGSLVRRWRELLREQPDVEWQALASIPEGWLGALQRAVSAVGDYLAEHPEGGDPSLREFLFEAQAFARLAERFGEHSLCELRRAGQGQAVMAIRNLVPADYLRSRFAAAHSTMLFSATLSPPAYHRDLLGLPDNSVVRRVASPFMAEQLEVRCRADISTRLKDRDASLGPIVEELAGQYRRQPGHYLAFFSSFAYLEAARARLEAAYPEVPLRAQQRGMSEAEREAFLAGFSPEGSGIAFAVLGGAFAEGIDLPGERLVGAFVITLGLPPFDPLNEALKQRLQARFGRGDDYAYRIPGMIKVVQAAGRVIRGPQDRGVVVLMDDRFARTENRALLPDWWRQ
ncbi:ATP-dependent DNA helicase [Halomonas almeriensis]|uniref:ATP-dependent DNA helicase n=1 Tax=Halomonas almeriensis TaxID=308163 RepID=UPI0025B33EBB|nr:ATP-dependent DNA helicase [Halomonas almeriensis]MDN3553873.1 ATP-dependent DNA helicase [Halomonas almeriensis]